MKTITVLFLLTVFLARVNACVVDPGMQILDSPDVFSEQADIVFFGTLTQLHEDDTLHQIAVFEVEEVNKGAWVRSIIVLNKLVSSCSRPFQGIGQRFYVYAVIDEETGNYTIDTRGGFVSEGAAKQFSLDPAPDS